MDDDDIDEQLERVMKRIDALVEPFTTRMSVLAGGRPVRWSRDHFKVRGLHVFNADTRDWRELIHRLWPLKDEIFATLGIAVPLHFHSCKESAEDHAELINEPRWAEARAEADSKAAADAAASSPR